LQALLETIFIDPLSFGERKVQFIAMIDSRNPFIGNHWWKVGRFVLKCQWFQ